jgi:X-Pro dipeptidyl-peptidase
MSFDLNPNDQIIPKGSQIGLMIFSSDQEYTLCPKPGTKLTIDPNSTSITIPIVGGINEYNAKDPIKN